MSWKPKSAFEVRDAKAEQALKKLGDKLRAEVPDGYVFALLIAQVGEGSNLFYTSNSERDCMIAVMKEFIKKFESN